MLVYSMLLETTLLKEALSVDVNTAGDVKAMQVTIFVVF